MAAAQERFSPAGLLLFAARGQKGPQMTKFKMNRTQFMLLTALNMLGSGILMLPAKVAQVGGIGLLLFALQQSQWHMPLPTAGFTPNIAWAV